MKNQIWTMLLVALLGITVLATAALAFTHVQFTRKINALQYSAGLINQNRNRVQALVNEAVEYSRRNPAIEPVLRDIGIKSLNLSEAEAR